MRVFSGWCRSNLTNSQTHNDCASPALFPCYCAICYQPIGRLALAVASSVLLNTAFHTSQRYKRTWCLRCSVGHAERKSKKRY